MLDWSSEETRLCVLQIDYLVNALKALPNLPSIHYP